MRKFLFYSGIFSVFFFFQCKNTETFTKSGKATLDGKVTNAVAPSISIDIQGENIDIPLSQDGSFKIDLEIPGAGIYKIGTGNQGVVLPVYLLPGEKTTLSCDGSNMIMTAKFEGQTKHENNFLVAKMFNEPNLIQIDQTTFFTLPEVDFLKQVEDVKSKLIEFKKEYQKQNGVFSPHFEEIVNQDITFQITNLKMLYPVYYNYLMKTNDFKPSENFYSYFQGLDVNNEINLQSDHFIDFVPLYIEHLLKEKNNNVENYESTGLNKLSILSETITSAKIREEISYQIMKESFETKLGDAFAMYESYLNQAKDEKKKKNIENLYNQWLPLKPGNVAPDFTALDKNGKSYSLAQLKGKVLYIDIWATWCGPCIAEIPYLEKLQDEFRGVKNIEFVSVSIDQNSEPWRKMVEAKNMKGLQLFAQGAWNSDVIANYRINGIPRFIIIDKDGKLVDGNAPRPSNPGTEQILKSLI